MFGLLRLKVGLLRYRVKWGVLHWLRERIFFGLEHRVERLEAYLGEALTDIMEKDIQRNKKDISVLQEAERKVKSDKWDRFMDWQEYHQDWLEETFSPWINQVSELAQRLRELESEVREQKGAGR